ncbi:Putative YrbE family protein [Mycobacteroides abscessus subsp. abscessus]|nr:Putative YrbE family protein [Mycobacteroides abscessus subsp. abscessus]
MTASTYVPPIARPFVGIYNRVQKPVTRLGHMVAFFFRAIAGVPIVLRHYWKEFLRHLSDIAWGNGSLVVGGGTARGTTSPVDDRQFTFTGESILAFWVHPGTE